MDNITITNKRDTCLVCNSEKMVSYEEDNITKQASITNYRQNFSQFKAFNSWCGGCGLLYTVRSLDFNVPTKVVK